MTDRQRPPGPACAATTTRPKSRWMPSFTASGWCSGSPAPRSCIAFTLRSSAVGDLPVAIVYATGLLAMLGFSAAYNLWPVSRIKWLLRRLRPFGDLSADRRDLHAVHRADEERAARDRPAGRVWRCGSRHPAEADAAGALRSFLDRALSRAQLERRGDVRRDRHPAGLDAVAARRRRIALHLRRRLSPRGKGCGSRTRSGTRSWCSPPRVTTRPCWTISPRHEKRPGLAPGRCR